MASFLPKDYGYVILSGAVGGLALNIYLASRVSRARKEHGVKFPTCYSVDNDAFNCVQRAHINYLESLPFFLSTGFIAGLENPRAAAACNLIYLLGRIVYAHGYYTGDPSKRSRGGFMYIGFFGNVGMCIYTAYNLLKN